MEGEGKDLRMKNDVKPPLYRQKMEKICFRGR